MLTCVKLQQLYQISTDKSAGLRTAARTSGSVQSRPVTHTQGMQGRVLASAISVEGISFPCVCFPGICVHHMTSHDMMSDNNVLPHCMLAVLSLPSLPVDASECCACCQLIQCQIALSLASTLRCNFSRMLLQSILMTATTTGMLLGQHMVT